MEFGAREDKQTAAFIREQFVHGNQGIKSSPSRPGVHSPPPSGPISSRRTSESIPDLMPNVLGSGLGDQSPGASSHKSSGKATDHWRQLLEEDNDEDAQSESYRVGKLVQVASE